MYPSNLKYGIKLANQEEMIQSLKLHSTSIAVEHGRSQNLKFIFPFSLLVLIRKDELGRFPSILAAGHPQLKVLSFWLRTANTKYAESDETNSNIPHQTICLEPA